MPKLKISVHLTAKEVREMLVPRFQKIFDSLVENMVKLGVDEEDAGAVVAREFVKYFNKKMKEG